jgi:predicted dehydrogenase
MRPPILVRGSGSIGIRHLQILRDHLRCGTLAWPIRSERLDELRQQGWIAIGSLAQAIAHEPQAAVIATDTSRHVADALALLDAGLPLLIEKPLAATTDGLSELAWHAHHAGQPVFVASPLRFATGLGYFRSVLPQAGRLAT